MTSEIRANKQTNRAGLGTVTYADTGIIVSGIVTCTELSGLTALNIAGVGTASTLDINGDIDVDGHTNLDNVSIAGLSTFTGRIDASDNIAITSGNRLYFGNSDVAFIKGVHGGSGYLSFGANNEHMRLTRVGYLLIGTESSRNTRLATNNFIPKIQLEDDAEAAFSMTRFINSGGPPRFVLQKARGTGASPVVVQNNDDIGQILFSGWDGDTFTNGAEIVAEVDGTPGDDQMPGRLIFKTNTGGTANTERLRITSDGDVAITSRGSVEGVSKLNVEIPARTTAFSASDGDTWHDVLIENPGAAQTNAVGLCFQVTGDSYHKNAGTGIAAVKNGTNSDYGSDLVFITRPQSAVAAERLRITSGGNLKIPDGGEIQFGGALNSGNGDLRILHDGTNSNIWDTGTGNLNINATSLNFNNNDIGGRYIECASNSHVKLYFAGSEKLATSSGGITVTGSLIATANVEAQNNMHVATNKKFLAGNANDIQIYHDGSSNRIIAANADLLLQSQAFTFRSENGSSTYMNINSSGLVDIFGDVKISTAGKGIDFSANTALSGASNVSQILDHYEEGTYVPTWTTISSSPSYYRNGIDSGTTSNGLSYVRIGKQVTITGTAYWSSSSINNQRPYMSLPFPARTYTVSGTVSHYSLGVATEIHYLNYDSTTSINFYVMAANSLHDSFGDNTLGEMYFDITYMTY